MHKQYPTNEEDIGFPKVPSAKQLPEINLELNTAKLEILPKLHLSSNLGEISNCLKGVFHCVLQPLCYYLDDMHKLTPNIHEVMAFPKRQSVKQNLRKVRSEICAV
jgi:hypothetical protein